MTRYKLPPSVIEQYDAETRQQTRLVGIGLVAGGIITMAVIAVVGLFPWTTLIFILPAWLLFVAVGMFFHGQTQRDTWSSYTIDITEHTVQQLRAGRKTVRIKRDEITDIDELPDTGLLIKTQRLLRVIMVPQEIEGYDEIKATLQGWFAQE